MKFNGCEILVHKGGNSYLLQNTNQCSKATKGIVYRRSMRMDDRMTADEGYAAWGSLVQGYVRSAQDTEDSWLQVLPHTISLSLNIWLKLMTVIASTPFSCGAFACYGVLVSWSMRLLKLRSVGVVFCLPV